ncbi:conserved hypothetical protein [Verticillium alfalfae VaMs.102]|uniref:Uncharacterized protein n=1 Tax=Verticillium alfalfae (strain VaMs.102 / ATCC MYA-4576 / FGSC 10136) TaxID=526221 RepID=C9SJA4_VERA1|nr:conserved hypothetical protein [Verticillium alfalfae VaMs.102]EEY18266.1 conserved hypothetical protein [Verticillium alfalfae VaMs.102]
MSTRYQRGTVDMLIELRRRLTVNLVRASKTPSHSPMTMPSRNASGSSFDFNTFLAPLADQDQDPDQEQDCDRSSYVQQQLHHFGPRHIAEPGLYDHRFQYPDPTEQSCVADSFGTPIPVRDTPSLVATTPAASYPGTPSNEKKQTKKSQSKKESKTAQGLHKAQDKQRQKRQASQPTTPAPKKPPSTPAKKTVTMSGQTGKFRDDQILVICPGSHTTMAQLGCGELTPPAHRIPTRMFKDSDSDEWRPYHTYKRKKSRTDNAPASGAEDEYEWVEDTDSDEGAVYPIVAGRIVNMNAFLAFLDHVHGLLTTTYHNTPIVLMVSPQWARPHTEMIARYIFENTRTPALCMIHSGLATTYGVRWTNATVVDIGFEKVDVSCIYEGRVVAHRMLGNFNPERIIAGGEAFTRKLQSLLKDKGFTYDMAEQLKKSPIAEALPYNPEAEARMDLPTASTVGVAANAVVGDAAAAAIPDAPKIDPSKPVVEGGVDDDAAAATTTGDNDGVLDITSIVTSGQTREFLAKKEKEKTTTGPGKGRKGKAQEAETARLTRLPNSKRTHNIFHYEEVIQEGPQQEPKPNGASQETNAPVDGNSNGNDKDVDMTDEPKTGSAAAPFPPTKPSPLIPPLSPPLRRPSPRRTPTRLRSASSVSSFVNRDGVDRIVGPIYRTIQESVYEMYMPPACWNNIWHCWRRRPSARPPREYLPDPAGASPRLAQHCHHVHLGASLQHGHAYRYRIAEAHRVLHSCSPSARLFRHHVVRRQPPAAGCNPPPPRSGLPPGGPSTPGAPGSAAGDPNSTSGGHSYHFHSQTPTSIKLAPMPSYLTQWTKHGFEDAMFLGCLVAGRLAFTVHNLDMASLDAQRMMSLNRIEYNEMGPKGIRTHSMLQ